MEEHNFKLIPILRYFSLILLFLAASAQSAHKTNNIYSALYYGDADVNVGEPFSITCIISISEPIQWLKDGTLINIRSNLRHLKDYVFIESDINIEGHDNRIEATLSVERAQPSHDGRYQCNSLHSNYHTLRVNKNHKSMAPGTSHHNKAMLVLNNTNDLITGSMESDQSLFQTSTNLHHHHQHQHHTVHRQSTNFRHHLNKETDATTKNDDNLSEFSPFPQPSPTESYSNINQNQHDLDKSNEFRKYNDNDDGINDKSYNENLDSDSDDVFHVTISEDNIIKEYDKNASINLDDLFDENKKSFLANETLIGVNKLVTLKSNDKSFSHEDLLKKDFRNDVETKTDEIDECIECVISGVVTGRNLSQKYEKYENKVTGLDTELHIPLANIETTSEDRNNINGITHVMDNDFSSTTAKVTMMGAADVLTPNYDNIEHKLKVFDETKTKPLILSCTINPPNKYKLSWLRNGTDVSLDPQLKGRYEIIDVENKFIISKPVEEDAGIFTCSVPDLKEKKDFNVVAAVFFKQISHSAAVVEGEKLKLHCIAFGTDPEIKWVIGNETYTESRGRIILEEDEKHIKNSVLIIENVVLEDRQIYNCTATNLAIKYGNANYSEAQEYIYVRVKGKLAALWPFLGICAEVFVLCAIILIYEKRRNKTELDESDTDQSPEQKNDHRGKETEIRQRK